jgi:maltose O-acetyltransferase
MASEKEKMLSGQIYNAYDPDLVAERKHARLLLHRLNTTEYGNPDKYSKIIFELLPNCTSDILIEPPFFCDYGYNVYAGHKVFFNFNCVILDVCRVLIGSNVMFGPGVHIYTATHPKEFMKRRDVFEFGKPVSIGDDCWIGGQTVILPGVNVGHRCIVGAGTVIAKDIPDDTVVTTRPQELT